MASILDQLRERRAELAATKTLTLPVPGYEERLGVVYRSLTSKELDMIGKNLKKKSAPIDSMVADVLIKTCQDIVWRDDEEGEWQPIADTPTTFSTGTLADLLEFSASSAREEVAELFSPDGTQPRAAHVHADALANWAQGIVDQSTDELMGE